MSDHDAAPDPIDGAYARAEAMLDDAAAREARRARVLGAVASAAQAEPPAASTPSSQGRSWRRGGWLAAASVAGLSALVAVRLYPLAGAQQEPPPAKPPAAAAPVAAITAAPIARTQAPDPAPAEAAAPSRAEPRDIPAAATPAPPPFQPAPAPAPAPPPAPVSPPAAENPSEVVLTGSRFASSPVLAPPVAARALSAAKEAAAPASPSVGAARLRAAAADGRMAELTALLAEGAPVDAPDDAGETALMKTVQADHPSAAALLRRHGADLDLRNHAGASARDMARAVGDPELDRALDLVP